MPTRWPSRHLNLKTKDGSVTSRLSNRPSNDAPPGCELPLGMLARGRRWRNVTFRKLRGDAQLRLLELNLRQPSERALSEALSHWVQKIGPLEDPSPGDFHRLTLCDRHALVRALLTARGGNTLSATAACPGCGSVLE